MHICIMHQISFREAQYCARRRLCNNSISQKGNKLACFANSSGSLRKQFGSWFLKKVSRGARFFVNAWYLKFQQGTHKNCVPEFLILSAPTLPSCRLVVFIDLNIHLYTYRWQKKIMLLLWTIVTYLFKKRLSIEY